jgi:hypothetical protein
MYRMQRVAIPVNVHAYRYLHERVNGQIKIFIRLYKKYLHLCCFGARARSQLRSTINGLVAGSCKCPLGDAHPEGHQP